MFIYIYMYIFRERETCVYIYIYRERDIHRCHSKYPQARLFPSDPAATRSSIPYENPLFGRPVNPVAALV